MKILLAVVIALCAWSAMSSFEDLFGSSLKNSIFRFKDDVLPASFEVNMTYNLNSNITYDVTVRLSDYYNILFYNMTFYDRRKRIREFKSSTYNLEGGYYYNQSSYNYNISGSYPYYGNRTMYANECYYGKINYNVSHPIVSFINMLWNYNKEKILQTPSKNGTYHQLYEVPLDNGTHVYVNLTKSNKHPIKVNSLYGLFLDNKAVYNLTSQVEPKVFSMRNLYPDRCWKYAYGRHY